MRAVEKLTFSSSLSLETTLSSEYRKTAPYGHVFFPCINSRYKVVPHSGKREVWTMLPEFMNLLRKFYFIRCCRTKRKN